MKNIIVIFGLISFVCVVHGKVLFSCDFDTNKCGGTQSPNGGVNYYFTLIDIISLEAYSVTDVSSITKPTSDGYVCEIPFFSPPVPRPFYHCTPTWTCKTEVSITQAEMSQVRCFQGKFLIGRTSLVVGPFPMNVQYTTPDIDLESSGNEEGEYELSFYLMMFCFSDPDLQPCIDSDDHISVMVLESNTDVDILNLNYTYNDFYPEDIVEKRMWIEKRVLFATQASEIKVIVQFERKIGNVIVGSFGLDSLAIVKNSTFTIIDKTEEIFVTAEAKSSITSQEIKTTEPNTITSSKDTTMIDSKTVQTSTYELETSDTETNSVVTIQTRDSTNPIILTTQVESTKITDGVQSTELSTTLKSTSSPITQTSLWLSTEEDETSTTKSPNGGLNVYHWIGIAIGSILILVILVAISVWIYKSCFSKANGIHPASTNEQNNNNMEMY